MALGAAVVGGACEPRAAFLTVDKRKRLISQKTAADKIPHRKIWKVRASELFAMRLALEVGRKPPATCK